MPGLNAAFVDVGYEKDAFLHYLDLGNNFNTLNCFIGWVQSNRKRIPPMSKAKQLPEIEKHGQLGDLLKTGQEILVQISKEPISTKGPRLSADISITGRFLVLILLPIKFFVSQKLKQMKREHRLSN